MADFEVVIKDEMILSGTGAPRFRIAICDGRIVEIGKVHIPSGLNVIDAGGGIVARNGKAATTR